MDFFPNKVQNSSINGFFLPYHFLNYIVFSLTYVTVRVLSMVHITYKICASQLFMLLVSLLVDGRLLVAKFSGSQESYGPLAPMLFKGHLYI